MRFRKRIDPLIKGFTPSINFTYVLSQVFLFRGFRGWAFVADTGKRMFLQGESPAQAPPPPHSCAHVWPSSTTL